MNRIAFGRIIRFITLLLAAFTLVPGMAHLLEMHHKMQLTVESYAAVQYIYQGWAWLGIIQVGAILFTGILVFYELKADGSVKFTLSAFICLLLTLIIFFTFTYPANIATNNWADLPENWTQLRQQWEYSHAVNAVLELAAYILLLLAVLKAR
jgi:hypothetical protein